MSKANPSAGAYKETTPDQQARFRKLCRMMERATAATIESAVLAVVLASPGLSRRQRTGLARRMVKHPNYDATMLDRARADAFSTRAAKILGMGLVLLALGLGQGCSTAQGSDAPRQGDNGVAVVGGAVPVVVETHRSGAPCVDYAEAQLDSTPYDDLWADVSCCPIGYDVVGLTHGYTGESAVICMVTP